MLAVGAFAVAVGEHVLLPAIEWLLLSLAVHALTQQKLVGHLLCIAGWVVAATFWNAAVPSELNRAPGVNLPVLFMSLLAVGAVVGVFWQRGSGSRIGQWFGWRWPNTTPIRND
jgi:hypothetical protein